MTMYIRDDGAFNSWLKEAKTGDSSVWDKLYLDATPMIKSFAKKNRMDRKQVEEIMQISTIIFFEKVMDGRLNRLDCKPTTYLYSVFRNQWLEHCRKAKARVHSHFDIEELTEELPDIDSTAPDIDHADLHTAVDHKSPVEQAFEKLGNKCQELLKLTVYAGINMTEVAQRLGYKDAHVASNQKYRCLKELKKLAIG